MSKKSVFRFSYGSGHCSESQQDGQSGLSLQESASLVFIKTHRIMIGAFSFFCCLSHSVGDLGWERGEGAVLFQVSLKVK